MNDYNTFHRVTTSVVIVAIIMLRTGKATDCGFQAEHLPNGFLKLFQYVALCFHGLMYDFLNGTIFPLLKYRSRSQDTVDNHWGITLSSLMSKPFELINLLLCGDDQGECQLLYRKGF